MWRVVWTPGVETRGAEDFSKFFVVCGRVVALFPVDGAGADRRLLPGWTTVVFVPVVERDEESTMQESESVTAAAPLVLSVGEAATLLGISRAHAYELVARASWRISGWVVGWWCLGG